MRYYFQCPKCQSDRSFSRPSEAFAGLALELALLVGSILCLAYADYRKHRVQCDRCGHLFRQPPLPKTSAAKLATAIVVVQMMTVLALIMLVVWPELADAVPGSAWLEAVATLLSGQFVPLLLLATVSFGATTLVCLIASISSSLAQKRTMAETFQLRVERRCMPDQKHPAPDAAPPTPGASLETVRE